MEEGGNPVNTGSTRSWKKCQDCRVQKKKCIPIHRDWPSEKCKRCEKLSLPCGPNISHKESRKTRATRLSTRQVAGNQEGHDVPELRLLSYGVSIEQVGAQAELPSQNSPVLDQIEGPESHHGMSFASNNSFFFARTQESSSIPPISQSTMMGSKMNQNNIHLQEKFRVLDGEVETLLYLQHTLKTSEKTGIKNQDAYGSLQILLRNIGGNIKSTMKEIELLADVSNEKYQAEVAYTRLMKTNNRLNDPDLFPTHPLLFKMVDFYQRNDEPFQAEELLRKLAEERPIYMTRYDFTRILDSYQTTSSHMSEMLQSLNLGGTALNVETPCPPFHRALQHEVPKMILNMMSTSSDIPDILLRKNMHVAIEAGRQDLIDDLIESRAGSGIDARDAFSRTSLQVAAQLRQSYAFEKLVSAGADRKARDATGRTTLEMAARAGCPNMVGMLLDDKIKGPCADVNDEAAWNTSTPLQAAAEEGHSEVVDILLERQAQVARPRLHDGKTAAELASERGHRDIAKRLWAKVDPMLGLCNPHEVCDSQTEMGYETS